MVDNLKVKIIYFKTTVGLVYKRGELNNKCSYESLRLADTKNSQDEGNIRIKTI